MEESRGDYQGGGIDIVGNEEVKTWIRTIMNVDALFDSECRDYNRNHADSVQIK